MPPTVYAHIPEYPEFMDETLISLQDACKKFPVPISRPGIERYWRHGQRGILLKTCFLVNKRYTSLEEIRRFVCAIQRKGNTPAALTKPSISKTAMKSAREKFNLPPSGKNGQPAEA